MRGVTNSPPLTSVASQNLVHATSNIHPDSRVIAALVRPELHTVDFAPKRRREDDYCAFAGDHRILRRADAVPPENPIRDDALVGVWYRSGRWSRF
jgi:hypothetical protein